MKIDAIATIMRVPTASATCADAAGDRKSIVAGRSEPGESPEAGVSDSSGQRPTSFLQVLANRMDADSSTSSQAATKTKPDPDNDDGKPRSTDDTEVAETNSVPLQPIVCAPPQPNPVPPGTIQPVSDPKPASDPMGVMPAPPLTPAGAASTIDTTLQLASQPVANPVGDPVLSSKSPTPAQMAELPSTDSNQPPKAIPPVESLIALKSEQPISNSALLPRPVTDSLAVQQPANVPVAAEVFPEPRGTKLTPANFFKSKTTPDFKQTPGVTAGEQSQSDGQAKGTAPAASPAPESVIQSVMAEFRHARDEIIKAVNSNTTTLDGASPVIVSRIVAFKSAAASAFTQIAEAVATRFADSPAADIHHADSTGASQLDSTNAVQNPFVIPASPQSDSPATPLHGLADRVTEIVMNRREGQQDDKSSVVLRLDPPELGRVNVHVSMSNDVVSIRMVAAGDMARQAIERQLNDLQASLTNQGVTFSQCQVECDPRGQSFDRPAKPQSANDYESLPYSGRRSGGLATAIATRSAALSRLDYVA